MSIAVKKKKIMQYLAKHLTTMDPSGYNTKRYMTMLSQMNDKAFDAFMKAMRDGHYELHLIMPNMINPLKIENVLKCAKDIGCPLFQRIKLKDAATGMTFLTNEKYLILETSVRRMVQFWDKKVGVPAGDKNFDAMTGQITGKDRASSVTNPEIQILFSRNLPNTLFEFVKVRGGDQQMYGDYKRSLEETGRVNVNELDKSSKSRTVKTAQLLFDGMHLSTTG